MKNTLKKFRAEAQGSNKDKFNHFAFLKYLSIQFKFNSFSIFPSYFQLLVSQNRPSVSNNKSSSVAVPTSPLSCHGYLLLATVKSPTIACSGENCYWNTGPVMMTGRMGTNLMGIRIIRILSWIKILFIIRSCHRWECGCLGCFLVLQIIKMIYFWIVIKSPRIKSIN